MNNSSVINAFRVLGRKPYLLLLLLPVHAATLLITKFLPETSTSFGVYDHEMTGLLVLLLQYGVIFLLSLLSSIFLIPPAMELLHDGVEDMETPSGWYRRGLKKHWWKPVALGAIETSIQTVLFVVVYFAIVIFALFISFGALTDAGSISSSATDEMSPLILLIVLVVVLPLFLVIGFISSIFSFLLPALADRSFGAAFKLAFSRRGMKKILKLYGVQILLGVAGGIIYVGFGAGYMLLSDGIPSSVDSAMSALGSFSSSWTGFFASLLISLTALYKYAYSFCLLREVRNEEDADDRSVFVHVSWL